MSGGSFFFCFFGCHVGTTIFYVPKSAAESAGRFAEYPPFSFGERAIIPSEVEKRGVSESFFSG